MDRSRGWILPLSSSFAPGDDPHDCGMGELERLPSGDRLLAMAAADTSDGLKPLPLPPPAPLTNATPLALEPAAATTVKSDSGSGRHTAESIRVSNGECGGSLAVRLLPAIVFQF